MLDVSVYYYVYFDLKSVERSIVMKKLYYELKSPASAVANKQEVTHMIEADLLSDALMRLDNMYDSQSVVNVVNCSIFL